MSPRPLVHVLAGGLLEVRLAALLTARDYQYHISNAVVDARKHLEDAVPDLLIGEVASGTTEILELCRGLRRDPRMQRTRVLLVSMRLDAEELLLGLEAGADDVLAGAYDDQAMAAKIEALLDGGRRRPQAHGEGPASVISGRERAASELEKMDAVGRLAGVVAHDFNNMLMVIKGFTDILGLSFEADDKRHQFAAEITKATDQAERMCGTLMQLSGRDLGEITAVDLHRVLDELRPELAQSVAGKVLLRIDCPADIGAVAANPERLKQTITNLCLNSMDAMPGGGELVIEARRFESGAVDNDESSAAAVLVELRDSGTGMSPETLSHVFEPYYTTKTAHKGLGLSIAYETLKGFGGHIECSSVPGSGTTIRLLFKDFEPGEAADART